MRRVLLVGVLVLMPALAWSATEIDLKNTDNTNTRWKSDENGGGKVSLNHLLGCEHANADEALGYCRVVGGIVRSTSIMTDVLTDTASATTSIPRGSKVFTANVDGTGAVTATVAIYGDVTSTAEAVNLLCTITLTSTTRDVDACPPSTAEYPFYHAVTSNVTGTGAAVDVQAHY
jgi:hypothetical protein